ncbi:MAG TPA: glycosyltransferase family 4 protein [Candidatus Udaeobacter sp.]|jgi:glycosyltransferase involved in cell wall biosynthesis|nr:glycosyltransferase family 4 protein [Candidatus Udaeobacter sp.]
MSTRGRVCFYAEHLFPVLRPRDGVAFAGGAETQLAQLGRGLVRRGFDVSVVTCDYGQPPRLSIDGLTVLRAFRQDSRIPVVRFFHPRLSRAFAALMAADAEVYYVNGSGMPAGITHDVARLRGAGFVLAAASDYDVIRSLPRHTGFGDRWWFLRALRDNDALLAQTEFQQRSLASEFGCASEVFPNIVELPAVSADPGRDGAVVWLGTYKGIKRPEWFTRLARDFPGRKFVMAGVVPPPPLTQEHWEAARAAAEDSPNLEVRGFIDHARIAELFGAASLLVHTSPMEGFSNVMLEAWAAGLPTVSSVDPDGVVERERLGAVATDYDALVNAVGRLLADPAARIEAGARARAYVASRHAPEAVLDQLGGVLDRVISATRARRGRAA